MNCDMLTKVDATTHRMKFRSNSSTCVNIYYSDRTRRLFCCSALLRCYPAGFVLLHNSPWSRQGSPMVIFIARLGRPSPPARRLSSIFLLLALSAAAVQTACNHPIYNLPGQFQHVRDISHVRGHGLGSTSPHLQSVDEYMPCIFVARFSPPLARRLSSRLYIHYVLGFIKFNRSIGTYI